MNNAKIKMTIFQAKMDYFSSQEVLFSQPHSGDVTAGCGHEFLLAKLQLTLKKTNKIIKPIAYNLCNTPHGCRVEKRRASLMD